MPPLAKITKEEIINVSLQIIEKNGISKLNARRIAKELNCSVQPIFHNFKNMEELKKVLYERIYEIYYLMMQEGKKEVKSYKGMGMAYIDFALQYPEYFKLLFMSDGKMRIDKFLDNEVIEEGRKVTGLNFEEQKKFHTKVFLFTHGIASLLVTKTIQMNREKINELLESIVLDMMKGIKK